MPQSSQEFCGVNCDVTGRPVACSTITSSQSPGLAPGPHGIAGDLGLGDVEEAVFATPPDKESRTCECKTLLFAGHGTSRRGNSFACERVSTNPECRRKPVCNCIWAICRSRARGGLTMQSQIESPMHSGTHRRLGEHFGRLHPIHGAASLVLALLVFVAFLVIIVITSGW